MELAQSPFLHTGLRSDEIYNGQPSPTGDNWARPNSFDSPPVTPRIGDQNPDFSTAQPVADNWEMSSSHDLPPSYGLMDAYPNPSSGTCSIDFSDDMIYLH